MTITLGRTLEPLNLVASGIAGGLREEVWEFDFPIQLDPGQAILIRNPQAMDAVGTWQVSVGVAWNEAPVMDYAG